MSTHATVPARPWWRFGMVWMVVAGPAIVVVAGIVTAVIAYRGADPVVRAAPVVQGGNASIALQPALAGRNHAATGVVPASSR